MGYILNTLTFCCRRYVSLRLSMSREIAIIGSDARESSIQNNARWEKKKLTGIYSWS
jgi:hypothetical protein